MGTNATVVPKSGQPNGRQLFLQGSPWENLSDTFKFGCLEQTYTNRGFLQVASLAGV